jgi:hypothetical protein
VKYHCYIEYREAVYTADVEAGSAREAAAAAATGCNVAGTWTVIQGSPEYLTVETSTRYRVTEEHGKTPPWPVG